MLESPSQYMKAASQMASTPLGMMVLLHPSNSILLTLPTMALQPCGEEKNSFDSSIVISCSIGHLSKSLKMHLGPSPNTIDFCHPMSLTPFPILTEVKRLHSAKALASMRSTESGITIFSKLLHFSKARSPISITELGKVMLFRPVHPEKASFSITVTESGMTTLVNSTQFLKASLPMQVTPWGIVISENLFPSNALLLITFNCDGIVSEAILHSLNADLPIEITESGMTTEVKLLQLKNAQSAISVTESGMTTEVRALQ